MARMPRLLAAKNREEEGCAYLLTFDKDAALAERCGATQQPRSPYCSHHHTLCHLPRGSRAERVRLREVSTLAEMVGGRRGREDGGPSQRFLARLEEAVREFS